MRILGPKLHMSAKERCERDTNKSGCDTLFNKKLTRLARLTIIFESMWYSLYILKLNPVQVFSYNVDRQTHYTDDSLEK